jgi:hypothetical protein
MAPIAGKTYKYQLILIDFLGEILPREIEVPCVHYGNKICFICKCSTTVISKVPRPTCAGIVFAVSMSIAVIEAYRAVRGLLESSDATA